MVNQVSIYRNNGREQGFKGSASLSQKISDKSYKNISINSAEYIKYIYKNLRKTFERPIEINVETGRLQDIVQAKKPCIFIMNHTTNQWKDIHAAKFFNTLLYREYIYHDMAETCPRTKILANTGLLDRQADKGELYKWCGVVPIDVGFNSKNKSKNKQVLKNLVNQLVDNKINLFLFPEGALAAMKFLPLSFKFQPGVSWIVQKILDFADRAKVVPLCFAHNKQGSAIHIGEPIYFRQKNGNYFASRGNANSENFDKDLLKFYSGKEEIMLTKQGKPVEQNKVIPYISGILMRNLECCTKDASTDLINSQPKVFVI